METVEQALIRQTVEGEQVLTLRSERMTVAGREHHVLVVRLRDWSTSRTLRGEDHRNDFAHEVAPALETSNQHGRCCHCV